VRLATQLYREQVERWPKTGRHVLAQYDDSSIVVYQAYRPSIGRWAAKHGTFGGPDFSFRRMSWIKPNFVWMMYRSGWGTKDGQEVTLAIRLRRQGFEAILSAAVPSTFPYGSQEDGETSALAEAPKAETQDSKQFATREEWQRASALSSVRLQWDPDHHPSGAKLERRAIQLGLRGDALRRYADEGIVEIEDISAYVAEQREHVVTRRYHQLVTPREDVYAIADPHVAAQLGIDAT
jgi:hypothetical protein